MQIRIDDDSELDSKFAMVKDIAMKYIAGEVEREALKHMRDKVLPPKSFLKRPASATTKPSAPSASSASSKGPEAPTTPPKKVPKTEQVDVEPLGLSMLEILAAET